MSYHVRLESFEGPFDLLLQLIARRQVEITEVDLAEITADFVTHLDTGLEDLDLETATRFLVVAATLLELKAARLLPTEEREDLDDLLADARDLLYARLLEYRAYRDVARVLDHRLRREEHRHPREVPPDDWIQRLVPEAPLPLDAAGLAALAAAVTTPAPPPEVDLTHIRRSYLTIRQAAREVLGALPPDGARAAFSALAGDRARGDRVVLFLALLELFKLGHVTLEQEHLRGPLDVALARLDRTADQLVAEVEDESDDEIDDETDDEGAAHGATERRTDLARTGPP